MLRTSKDLMKENGFKLVKERNRRYPAQTIKDADYTDDIALLANPPNLCYIVWKEHQVAQASVSTQTIQNNIIKELTFPHKWVFSCLSFWDEAWWFVPLRVFGLLSSSLFSKRFGRYVFRTSSGACRNFDLRPLLNPWVLPVLIPLVITEHKC